VLPVASVRLFLKLFAGEKDESVGTLCLRMCPLGELSCTGAAGPDSCFSSASRVLGLAPLIARGLPGLIVGPAATTVDIELHKSLIKPKGEEKLELTFDLGIDQMLQVLKLALKRQISERRRPTPTSLAVPVSLEGGVFVLPPPDAQLGNERKVAWFGPTEGTFTL
jgi:hypothetical protein